MISSPFHSHVLLRRASLTESDAFAFLRADNEDCITYSGFCEALRQLNLIGHSHGLNEEEKGVVGPSRHIWKWCS